MDGYMDRYMNGWICGCILTVLGETKALSHGHIKISKGLGLEFRSHGSPQSLNLHFNQWDMCTPGGPLFPHAEHLLVSFM
jgi:hypothetical protein